MSKRNEHAVRARGTHAFEDAPRTLNPFRASREPKCDEKGEKRENKSGGEEKWKMREGRKGGWEKS